MTLARRRRMVPRLPPRDHDREGRVSAWIMRQPGLHTSTEWFVLRARVALDDVRPRRRPSRKDISSDSRPTAGPFHHRRVGNPGRPLS